MRRNLGYLRRAGLSVPHPERRVEWTALHAQGALADHAGELSPRARRPLPALRPLGPARGRSLETHPFPSLAPAATPG